MTTTTTGPPGHTPNTELSSSNVHLTSMATSLDADLALEIANSGKKEEVIAAGMGHTKDEPRCSVESVDSVVSPKKPRWTQKEAWLGLPLGLWVSMSLILVVCIGIMLTLFLLGPTAGHHGSPLEAYRPIEKGQTGSVFSLDESHPLEHVEFHIDIDGHTGGLSDHVAQLEVTVNGVKRSDENADWEPINGLQFKATQYTQEMLTISSSFDFTCAECKGTFHGLHVTTNSNHTHVATVHMVQLGTIGKYQVLISGLLLLLMYAGIVSEVMHRTLIAFLGMFFTLLFLCVMGKAPSLSVAFEWLDEGVIVLLFGMMIIVNVLSKTGLFEWVAIRAYLLASNRYSVLLVVLTGATAFLSAFLDNVTTMLLIAPVTIRLANDLLRIDPRPLLIAECIMSNIGGTATMIGDPPNIIIGSKLSGQIQFLDFIVNLTPAVIVIYGAVVGFLLLYYRKTLRQPITIENFAHVQHECTIRDPFLLLKTGTVFFVVLILFFTEPIHHVNISYVALMGAVLMLLIVSQHSIAEALEHVEWDTLCFFAALFIMIEGLAEMGLIRWIGDQVKSWVAAVDPEMRLAVAMIILLWVSGLVSAFLDNIPYTATMVPVVTSLASDPSLGLPLKPLAWALALGACLGGNGTVVGASANLVTVGLAGRKGHHISFMDWLKVGFPCLLISLIISTIYCLVVYVAIGTKN